MNPSNNIKLYTIEVKNKHLYVQQTERLASSFTQFKSYTMLASSLTSGTHLIKDGYEGGHDSYNILIDPRNALEEIDLDFRYFKKGSLLFISLGFLEELYSENDINTSKRILDWIIKDLQPKKIIFYSSNAKVRDQNPAFVDRTIVPNDNGQMAQIKGNIIRKKIESIVECPKAAQNYFKDYLGRNPECEILQMNKWQEIARLTRDFFPLLQRLGIYQHIADSYYFFRVKFFFSFIKPNGKGRELSIRWNFMTPVLGFIISSVALATIFALYNEGIIIGELMPNITIGISAVTILMSAWASLLTDPYSRKQELILELKRPVVLTAGSLLINVAIGYGGIIHGLMYQAELAMQFDLWSGGAIAGAISIIPSMIIGLICYGLMSKGKAKHEFNIDSTFYKFSIGAGIIGVSTATMLSFVLRETLLTDSLLDPTLVEISCVVAAVAIAMVINIISSWTYNTYKFADTY